MRNKGKEILLLIGAVATALSPAMGSGVLWKIDSWGTHGVTLDTGGSSNPVPITIVASETRAGGGLAGVPVSMTKVAEGATIRFLPGLLIQEAQLAPGGVYSSTIDYRPEMKYVLIRFQVNVTQGNIFNNGKVVVTDTPDYLRWNARTLYGEVYARQMFSPFWQALLGVMFWVTGYGIPFATLFWGVRYNTTSFIYEVPQGQSVTVYYKMTGCTAFRDFDSSFTIPSTLQPGRVYGVNVYGWCGFLGFGNWARVETSW